MPRTETQVHSRIEQLPCERGFSAETVDNPDRFLCGPGSPGLGKQTLSRRKQLAPCAHAVDYQRQSQPCRKPCLCHENILLNVKPRPAQSVEPAFANSRELRWRRLGQMTLGLERFSDIGPSGVPRMYA